ncbi:ATP synthase F1 subunit delta [Buchnera aphidicola]|uniref:ATP synthase F1 subunit delta n=1 Tax=Buchnera aphidicola TaxID=9 RepID=UPI0031B8A296
MQQEITISFSYAKAIFDVAVKKKKLEEWKLMLYRLKKIFKLKFLNIFFNEIYPVNTVLHVIQIAYQKEMSIHEINFIKLLILNKRLYIISRIYILFLHFYNQYHNIVHVELISANNLNETKKKKICSFLSNKMGKNIDLLCKTDSSILYGFILRYEGFVIEYNGLKNLQEFSEHLLS